MTTDAASGAALGAELAAARTPIALLLMADGAACHGPKAPRAEDSRAGAYEDAVNAALAAGDPAALRRARPGPGPELSAHRPGAVAAAVGGGGGAGLDRRGAAQRRARTAWAGPSPSGDAPALTAPTGAVRRGAGA